MEKGRSTSSGGPKEASELIIREIKDSVRRIVPLDWFMLGGTWRTVVFALTVTEAASECVFPTSRFRNNLIKDDSAVFSRFRHVWKVSYCYL